MIKLDPFQACPFSDFCLYYKDCEGTNDKRKTSFTCTLEFDNNKEVNNKTGESRGDFRVDVEQGCSSCFS